MPLDRMLALLSPFRMILASVASAMPHILNTRLAIQFARRLPNFSGLSAAFSAHVMAARTVLVVLAVENNGGMGFSCKEIAECDNFTVPVRLIRRAKPVLFLTET
jgi:hypothetical protein